MNNTSICLYNLIINWNVLITVLSVISGFFVATTIYLKNGGRAVIMSLFYTLSIILSFLLSRLLHYLCHLEQYNNIGEAFTNYNIGSFFMPGIVLAVIILAAILRAVKLIDNLSILLDAMAPSLAFVMSMIRFADRFTGECQGKYVIPSYLVSFLILLALFILLFILGISALSPAKGDMFRLFLAIYGASEIFIDSTRNDASHVFLPGESMIAFNNASGFVALSQIIGAILCIYIFIYYIVKIIKVNKMLDVNEKISKLVLKLVALILYFIAACSFIGLAEYKVQRHSSEFVKYYSIQVTAIIVMLVTIYLMYRIHKKAVYKSISQRCPS